MNIKHNLTSSAIILKSHVNKYTYIGLIIAIGSIIIASLAVSYQITGSISLSGFIEAQRTNPAIWILNLFPFMYVYWGQSFCYGLVNKAQNYISDKTKEFLNISSNLESKLKYESHHDSLTNLPNARMFGEQVKQAITQIGPKGELAIVVIKINDFSNISFNFGTFNANSVLKQFADKLKHILLDPYMLQVSMGICVAARLQSEEFALLLPRLKKNFNVNEFMSVLTRLITFNVMIDGITISISTTLGVALFPQHGQEDPVLLSHAHIALYHAIQGNKPYVIYEAEMEEDTTQNRLLMNELKRSVENDELEIYYQPVVDFQSGKIIGAESLVRFEHPEHGLLSADKFIPLIENTDLICQLTAFMLKGVIRQLAQWHSEGYKISASVNLSVKDLSDRKLPEFIQKLLKSSNIGPEFLKLEFTERACLTDQATTKDVLEQLSMMGIQLCIDDFCSGYTTFTYLTNFPIDEIKIEKSYVLNMTKDVKKTQVVKAIINLANTLGLHAFADGVANEETLKSLIDLGCDYGQGFHFSRAVAAKDFDDLLIKKHLP